MMKVFYIGFIYMFMFFSVSTHPLFLSLVLVFSALTISVILYSNINLWIMYSILLIFLGGMMVLFLYVSILNNEEKFFIMKNFFLILFFLILMSMLIFNDSSHVMSVDYKNVNLTMNNLYMSLNFLGMIFLMFYLLLSLFVTVKFSESFKGSLMKTKF